MIKNYLKEQILMNFGFKPTSGQEEVVDSLCEFLFSSTNDEVFILRGFAGTGKTSLVSALVKTMAQISRKCVLMAPTGRAAKVFSLYSDHPAFTIHKRIYRQKSIDQDSIFSLNYNMLANTLFIVDESSMISNEGLSGTMYGTGRLLDDLVHFVYGGNGCRLILMGDTAQLPPVGEGESPALQENVMEGYGLSVRHHTLKQVVRQQEESGILWNATRLRQIIEDEEFFNLPKIRFSGFADTKNIPGNELIEALSECYNRCGTDGTIVICRSNKRAYIYNNGIRNQILGREEELSSGDLLMIAKNNYFWMKPETVQDEKSEERKDACTDADNPSNQERRTSTDFIANGDVAIVERVRNIRELYGFRFADCWLRLPDYDDLEIEATVLLDTLHAEAPALTKEQSERLFNNVMEDYMDIPNKRDRMKKMKEDPYFNALQVKYAYAITCHKAQGGQWEKVFIDQGYMTDDMLDPDYFRWLYTAITRATDTVHFVNWKSEQSE